MKRTLPLAAAKAKRKRPKPAPPTARSKRITTVAAINKANALFWDYEKLRDQVQSNAHLGDEQRALLLEHGHKAIEDRLSQPELASGKNSFTVLASAIKVKDAEGNELPWSDQQMEENRYHAHIPIPQDGDDKYENAEIFAHRFREKVKRICLPDGKVLKSLPTAGIPASAGPSRFLAAIKWCVEKSRFGSGNVLRIPRC
jgi:hypothetical protein